MDTYGPCQDERNLESIPGSDPREGRRRKVTYLSSCGFNFPVYVLHREFDGNHHHPPTACPVDNRPKMRTIQYMTRKVCLSDGPPGSIVSHFVGGIYEPYVRIPVDSFACSQEVDDPANRPVNQLSMDKILDFHFHQTGRSFTRRSILP